MHLVPEQAGTAKHSQTHRARCHGPFRAVARTPRGRHLHDEACSRGCDLQRCVVEVEARASLASRPQCLVDAPVPPHHREGRPSAEGYPQQGHTRAHRCTAHPAPPIRIATDHVPARALRMATTGTQLPGHERPRSEADRSVPARHPPRDTQTPRSEMSLRPGQCRRPLSVPGCRHDRIRSRYALMARRLAHAAGVRGVVAAQSIRCGDPTAVTGTKTRTSHPPVGYTGPTRGIAEEP